MEHEKTGDVDINRRRLDDVQYRKAAIDVFRVSLTLIFRPSVGLTFLPAT